jgi:NAD(P)H dehydrogenase (quinone)
MKPTILIAGATGATGSVATRLLLEKGFPVRAFVHKEDERVETLKALGAETFVGELLDFRAVRRAFDGIKRAYFVYPMRPGLVQATAHYAQAALEARAEFIVNMSQRTARPDALSDSALQHWLAERVFDWADTPLTHLRPTVFNEWLLYVRKGIREGQYRVPFGPTGKAATISAEDQGAVIAEILANPAPHAGQTYPLLGPVELTPPEIAEIVSRTLGKPVRYVQITGAQWVEEATKVPGNPFLIQHASAVAEMHALGQTAGTNDVVETIIGRKPQTVAEFVEKHRAAFQ